MKIYTVVFSNEELHNVLEQLKMKTSLDFEFKDYPNVEYFKDLNAVVLYLNDDLTYSGIIHLFTEQDDPDSPFVKSYQFVSIYEFIESGIKMFKKN
jgi:hypothetical protein